MTAVPLTLYVDTAVWHEHLRSVVKEQPGLAPVLKGNGYGFTVPVLARAAEAVGAERIAVGTAEDAAAALGLFSGEVLVMDARAAAEPLPADAAGRVAYTVSSLEDVAAAGDRRLVVDCRSTLLRQGVAEPELSELRRLTARRRIDGFSLHLPIDRPPGADHVAETARWVRTLTRTGFDVPAMYVSHLDAAEVDELAHAFPDTRFHARVGTRLWLGERAAFGAAATVLQVIPVRRGERLGYRQDRSAHDGWLIVVSGGRIHGVGLEAPKRLRGLAPRVKALARTGLAVANRARSPFAWAGQKQWFAEPPHMLVSMLLLPRRVEPPWPGAELPVDLGLTVTHFDRVVTY